MNIIQEALYLTGWTQRELSERTGISEKKISSKKYHPPDKLVLTAGEHDSIKKIIEEYT
jgi:transcriptional regulator with XRE-family HTH domain